MKRVDLSTTLRRCAATTVAALAIMPLVTDAQRADVSVTSAPQGRHSVLEQYGKLPLGFEANQGQTDRQVKYLSRGPGYVLLLTSTEAVVVAPQAVARMTLVGANTRAAISGVGELPGRSNYYIGNDPTQWRTDVPQYAQVRYEEIYPGIDLVYYGTQEGRVEHDFIVSPGVDPGIIALAFQGTDRPKLGRDGDLILHTSPSSRTASGSQIRLRKPVIYQEVNGARREVSGGYVIGKDNRVGFRIGEYDASRPLIIDPVLAIGYSTFLGGSLTDNAIAIAVDAAGNAHVFGNTVSVNFPTVNAAQPMNGGGLDDFVAKLSPDGSALVYSTYLGGTATESTNVGSIALDGAGNAYVAGSTNSTDFPTTLGAYQPTLAGINDGYVVKLNASGALVFSTYLGGNSADGLNGVAADAAGNAYVVGSTISFNFPTTPGAFKTTLMTQDATVSKLSANGSLLLYSTFLGGDTGSAFEVAHGVAVDALGNAYVTGITGSPDFPTTLLAAQPVYGGGCMSCGDAFVTKLNALGTGLIYSTFLGGSDADRGNDIELDVSGAAYVMGDTASINFPTVNALQPTYGGGPADAFITKVNPLGSAFVYSTYLGGSQIEGTGFVNTGIVGLGIVVDGGGSAYVSGATRSADFPSVAALQPFATGSSNDHYQAFIAKLNAPGSALEFSTPVSPPVVMTPQVDIGIDTSGNAYIAGGAQAGFPTTPGSRQPVAAGGMDAFILKLTTASGTPATLTLDPPAAMNPVGTQHCVTAIVRDSADDPTPDVVVRFTVTGAVNTSGTATTDGDGEAVFCYQGPPLPGADVITAFADTDNDGTQDLGEPSGVAAKTWLLPQTTPLCEIRITNGGWIIAANGDLATFGGNAQSSATGVTQGQEEYQDHGPAQPLNMHSINVQAIVCESGDTQATIFGLATINGAGSFAYRIRVQDLGEPGAGHDTYWLILGNGYDSGERVLLGGNVQITRN
jgi:hypothetical protein